MMAAEETPAEWLARAHRAWTIANSMENPLARQCMEHIAAIYEAFARKELQRIASDRDATV
jgi:hypothetical protein